MKVAPALVLFIFTSRSTRGSYLVHLVIRTLSTGLSGATRTSTVAVVRRAASFFASESVPGRAVGSPTAMIPPGVTSVGIHGAPDDPGRTSRDSTNVPAGTPDALKVTTTRMYQPLIGPPGIIWSTDTSLPRTSSVSCRGLVMGAPAAEPEGATRTAMRAASIPTANAGERWCLVPWIVMWTPKKPDQGGRAVPNTLVDLNEQDQRLATRCGPSRPLHRTHGPSRPLRTVPWGSRLVGVTHSLTGLSQGPLSEARLVQPAHENLRRVAVARHDPGVT